MKQTTKPKRIKRVFSSSQEVLHIWAAQSQSDARQSGRGNVFFEGKSCYSYGYHYELGRIVEINGTKVALINTRGYSNTTAKHIGKARRAVSHMPTIKVDGTFDWKKGLLVMQDSLINSLFDQLNGLNFYKGYKAYDGYSREGFEKFNNLCKVVGMPQLQLFPDSETVQVINDHIKTRLFRKEEKNTYKLTPEYAAAQAEKMQRELIEAEKARLERIIKGQVEVEAWKNGGPFTNAVNSLHPQLIRVKGDKVETSSQATVSLADACRALMHVENRQLKKGDKIGDFEFTSIKGDTVTIGCHELSLEQAKSVLSDALKKQA